MFLSEAEDKNCANVIGEFAWYLAQSETLCTWRSSLTGTWEVSMLPAQAGRLSKARATCLT